ncbi:hypothetical protein HPB48_012765 [Haemaphysalis longicornis]|uniref:Tick transposon n=1 Tax=Haemaphysalis longicornis TaxID=44386 RepID=A0A9J6GBA2_HAELO|nr:hypothetical protein HPB48_012765 [Haemaphysalis longicornis]
MDCLKVFFSVKTHKKGLPLRAVVSEKGSWQGVMSKFIQDHLNILSVKDPFRIRNSLELVDFLAISHSTGANFAFSIDVEDFFYAVFQREMVDTVMTLIEETGPIAFHNASRLFINDFMNLLPPIDLCYF